MLFGQSKEVIFRDLLDLAVKVYGPDRAAALSTEIDQMAQALTLIASHELELDTGEPDFLVAFPWKEACP